MDPVSSASVKAAGSITSAIINRYRPVGVARIGSPEDRARAYRRFLDSLTAHILPVHRIRRLMLGGISPTDSLLNHLFIQEAEASVELACALDEVRLCAPRYVIEQAEAIAMVWWEPGRDMSDEDFAALIRAATGVKASFMDAARHDLDYNPKRWNLLARYKEAKYRDKSTLIGE